MMEILPRKGLGEARLGMSLPELRSVLGQEESQSSLEDGTEVYFQNEINCALRNGFAYQFGATRRASSIIYKDHDIFLDDPLTILKKMQDDDGSPFECFGFIVFINLGVSLTGFHDDDLDQKAMTVFEDDTWADLKSDFKSIRF